jgi:membrane protease subunit HflC
MKRLLNLLVALVLALLLIGYAVAYSVRFNESVIVTTLGGADEGAVKNAPDGENETGLHFKWPWPIQQVAARFDTRIQVLEAAVEQATTADQQSVVLRVTMSWRVQDPLAFYKSLGSLDAAASQLRTRIRASYSLVGDYRFTDLANLDGAGQTLDELAERMKDLVQSDFDERGYGLVVEDVGITKLELPGAVLETVFQRMQTERDVLARRATEAGQAEGATILEFAEQDARTILAFANREAATIESRGEQQAAELFAQLNGAAAELAMLLDELDTTVQSINGRDRWFIQVGSMYPFNQLVSGVEEEDE